MNCEENFYIAFGKFLIEFEMITNALQSMIRLILDLEGLTNDRIASCLLAGMTAEPIAALAQSVCYEHLHPEEKDSEIIDAVFSEYRKLISKRNDLVHGQHFLFSKFSNGDSAPYRDITFSVKLHKNKRGLATKHTQYDSGQLEALFGEARTSLSNLIKIRNCIEFRCNISVNFDEPKPRIFRAKIGELVKNA